MVNFKKLNLIVLLGTAMIGAQVPCAYGMNEPETDASEKDSRIASTLIGGVGSLLGDPGFPSDDSGLIGGGGSLLGDPGFPSDDSLMGPDPSAPPPASIKIYAFGHPKEYPNVLIQTNTLDLQTSSLHQTFTPVGY